ncbi:MAG: PEP-CTERM sorting domain-containing protein [Aeoliella sp.]
MDYSSAMFRKSRAGWIIIGLFLVNFCAAANSYGVFTTVQNDYYVINVVNDTSTQPPDSIGGFQLHTGPLHPAGPDKDITYGSSGNVNIGTSFSGIRVSGDNANAYTSDTHGAGTASPVINLDEFFSTQGATPGYASSGWRTHWDLFAEQLEIVQDVIAVGDHFDQSAIYHTVNIINGRNSPVQIDWLNLMDFDTNTDGGPSNTVERSGGIVLVENSHEYSHTPSLPDELVRISDFPGLGTYDAFWSISHDPGLRPVLEGEPLVVTTPDEFQFVAWATAFNPANFGLPLNVFDYLVDPTLDVATSLDSAGIAKFSATIPTNGSVRFTQVFWVQPIPEPSTLPLIVLSLAILAFCRLQNVERNS